MSDSKEIISPQSTVYDRLDEIVYKHMHTVYKKPLQTHNVDAFKQMQAQIAERNTQHLIMDSCCGTGLSTMRLAQQNPEALVIGIDRSAKRLSKESEFFQQQPENCIFMRANCEDIWRLCVENKLRFDQHYILYPNPYPKPEHFRRRWHGHPVFPILRALTDNTILRSNWRTYLDEFSLAWQLLTGHTYSVQTLDNTPILNGEAMTLFERKYAASKQTLYSLHVAS